MAKTIIEYLENNKKLLQNHYQKVKHLDSASPTGYCGSHKCGSHKHKFFYFVRVQFYMLGKKLIIIIIIVILYIYLYIFVCVCMRRSSNDKSILLVLRVLIFWKKIYCTIDDLSSTLFTPLFHI
jgi:hypothetical protein